MSEHLHAGSRRSSGSVTARRGRTSVRARHLDFDQRRIATVTTFDRTAAVPFA